MPYRQLRPITYHLLIFYSFGIQDIIGETLTETAMQTIPVLVTYKQKLAFCLLDPDTGDLGLVRYLRDIDLRLQKSTMPTQRTVLLASGDECLTIRSEADLLEPLLMTMASDINQAVLKQVAKFGGEKYAKQQAEIKRQGIIRGC